MKDHLFSLIEPRHIQRENYLSNILCYILKNNIRFRVGFCKLIKTIIGRKAGSIRASSIEREVYIEGGRLDIVFNVGKIRVIIEVKKDSDPDKDQIERYRLAEPTSLVILLAPSNTIGKDVLFISWGEVYNLVEEVADSVSHKSYMGGIIFEFKHYLKTCGFDPCSIKSEFDNEYFKNINNILQKNFKKLLLNKYPGMKYHKCKTKYKTGDNTPFYQGFYIYLKPDMIGVSSWGKGKCPPYISIIVHYKYGLVMTLSSFQDWYFPKQKALFQKGWIETDTKKGYFWGNVQPKMINILDAKTLFDRKKKESAAQELLLQIEQKLFKIIGLNVGQNA